MTSRASPQSTRAYRQMMEHWAKVLPGRVIDVDHEALVTDPEPRIRWLVTEACGLDWTDACLAFHAARTPVRTASSAQVRQPIFTTSLQRWRRYEPQLGPLLRAREGACRRLALHPPVTPAGHPLAGGRAGAGRAAVQLGVVCEPEGPAPALRRSRGLAGVTEVAAQFGGSCTTPPVPPLTMPFTSASPLASGLTVVVGAVFGAGASSSARESTMCAHSGRCAPAAAASQRSDPFTGAADVSRVRAAA